MLEDGLKNAVQVVTEPHVVVSQAMTDSIVAADTTHTVTMQTVVGAPPSQAEAITINLPVNSLQTDALHVTMPDSSTTVLPNDYMNILDIVLDNSKLDLQNSNIGGNQAIVLAEVDGTSGQMVAVTQGGTGNTIALTPEQVNALTAAAAREVNNAVPLITTDDTTLSQPTDGTILATMADLKGKLVDNVKDIVMKDDNGDEIEFEEDMETVQEFEEPVGGSSAESKNVEKSGTKGEHKYKCDECAKPYVTKAALKKHLQLVHNKEMEGQVQKATSKCIHPGCEKIFYHRQKMIDHLREAHGVKCVQEDLVFNSWDEFLLWKEKEEDANFVHFSKNSTHTNAKNYMLTNFTCQREGKAGYKYKGSQQKKYKDLVIGERICPARMRARLDKPTGRVTVQYCKSHNHKLSFQDFLYRRMPDRLRNEIREKLAAGMTSEEVYKELKSSDNLRESRGERFAPSKRQFVTLVNIKTIAKRMQIKESGPPKNFVLEPEPYAIQMQKLLDETYNPVLLYKDQGCNVEIGPEEIDQITGAHDLLLIGIQTKEQKDVFIKNGHKIVFIDITETLITPTQYLITVKVLDEYNKGYPVAYLISNSRDETILFYFFRELQVRVQDTDLKVTAVMTENSCNEYYAFRSVFGDDVKHLLCKWNLHRAWCQKIHEECAGDEALQQELYFIFVTMLEEVDLAKFESIATEFVNNYQSRCANFITFFMSNYLSQPEVWASCYRNNPYADCDEILYGDRLHDRIKREIKNNHKVKAIDDILDLILKFEHEDYFNRGLNLMLNPPEPMLVISEHIAGMKIKNASVVENYSTDNRWLVKTTKRDPADLQSIKEEAFIVTWKADICEKDFCRERCLKLACFGLCGHLYHCSCDTETVTPCRHVHKVHSMRIGVGQYQNDEESSKEENKEASDEIDHGKVDMVTTELIGETNQSEQKLNLINQVHATTAPDLSHAREQKLKKIKLDLVQLYKFLEKDNIQKYSLDFIEAGLKKVIDECKVIDSIGQSKSIESFHGKRKAPEKDLEEFELLVRSVKRKKVMGTSVPVIVEIEPNPAVYNTFRKRMTGSNEETPEDRMLRLSKSKNITINIESDEKYRKTQSQQVTSTPGIIVAKEGDESPLKVEDEEFKLDLYQPDEADTEWTPRGPRKGKAKSKSLGRKKNTKPKAASIEIPPFADFSDPLKVTIRNGNCGLSMIEIKTLDTNALETEKEIISKTIPNYTENLIPDAVVNSYLHVLSEKNNSLFLLTEQTQSLCNSEPHNKRFWDIKDLNGDKKRKYIFIPWKNHDVICLFVIDLYNENIMHMNPLKKLEEIPADVKTIYSMLAGVMITEIPFDSTRTTQPTWPLLLPDYVVETDLKNASVRSLWYANQLSTNQSIADTLPSMDNFRKFIFFDIAGCCLVHCIKETLHVCPVCSMEEGTSIECSRCKQMYHADCLKENSKDNPFICLF
ncbi:uncharacterized protein LOC130621667 isoform X2 [Hydractinia symbiolongicarpus]|nr:uncharacterized protein LOC130621667 isoform X2 [Hydractinia symbiolongicarpus]